MNPTNTEVLFERQFGRILSNVESTGLASSVPISLEAPEKFTKMLNNIAIGDIYYREFYTDVLNKTVSSHCKMSEGAVLKNHSHPNCDEYIYVINGKLVEHLTDDIIVPPEEHHSVKELMHENDVHSWYHIPAGRLHMFQAIEPNTQFVVKFVFNDV